MHLSRFLTGAEWNDAGASRVSALCNLGKGEQVKFITGPKKTPLCSWRRGLWRQWPCMEIESRRQARGIFPSDSGMDVR